LLNRLREHEEKDPDCVAYTRFKPKDDATALMFEIVSWSYSELSVP
jgi:hypothetical protein